MSSIITGTRVCLGCWRVMIFKITAFIFPFLRYQLSIEDLVAADAVGIAMLVCLAEISAVDFAVAQT